MPSAAWRMSAAAPCMLSVAALSAFSMPAIARRIPCRVSLAPRISAHRVGAVGDQVGGQGQQLGDLLALAAAVAERLDHPLQDVDEQGRADDAEQEDADPGRGGAERLELAGSGEAALLPAVQEVGALRGLAEGGQHPHELVPGPEHGEEDEDVADSAQQPQQQVRPARRGGVGHQGVGRVGGGQVGAGQARAAVGQAARDRPQQLCARRRGGAGVPVELLGDVGQVVVTVG